LFIEWCLLFAAVSGGAIKILIFQGYLRSGGAERHF